MCTVTYIPLKDTVLLTSSRDEKAWRKQAICPKVYNVGDSLLLFPKDPDAGGTWIAANDSGATGILLNGAFVKHTPAPPYVKSRGLVLLDVMQQDDPFAYFEEVELGGIEPFTLIIFAGKQLNECRWDGSRKHVTLKDADQPYIWSSATLYDDAVVERRDAWFRNWLVNNPVRTAENIMNFHLFGGDGDRYNDLRMNRDGIVYTVSITGVEIHDDQTVMRHHDMKDDVVYTQALPTISSPIIKPVPYTNQ